MGLVSARRRLLVLPDLSVLWVVVFVLALAIILNVLVFRPVLEVIKQREDVTASARALAERAAAEARRATEELERQTAEVRADVYRQMDEMRRGALEQRAELINATRREAERSLAEARATLARDVADARVRLDAEADALAEDAAMRILGRRAS